VSRGRFCWTAALNLDPSCAPDTRAELGQLHRLARDDDSCDARPGRSDDAWDRIAVLRATPPNIAPLEVYRRPVNAFVATFVSSPKMNLRCRAA
jgi:hypothetical protein